MSGRTVLKRTDAAVLRKAARGTVEEYFTARVGSPRAGQLARSNRYRLRCTERYEEDIKTHPSSERPRHVVSYVSASVPEHIIDGWAFLARALDSAMRGDTATTIHCAYYAELRAAMGLLASEGVGIFNRKHPVVISRDTTQVFPPAKKRMATHEAIWPVLNHWASLQRATDLFDQLVRPLSVSMSDWLKAVGAMGTSRAIARKWLAAWGVDLAVIKEDQDLRHMASYRPSAFRKPSRLPAEFVAQFVEELWALFEPAEGQRFPRLENLLLQRALRLAGITTVTPEQLESSLGLSHAEAVNWAEFLQAPNDPLPFLLANEQGSVEDARCHLQVASRAALLLSVATLAARRLISAAGFDRANCPVEWKEHGTDRGLWTASESPDNPFDSWADIKAAVSASEAWRGAAIPNAVSLRDWRRHDEWAVDNLGSIELIGVWGLIP